MHARSKAIALLLSVATLASAGSAPALARSGAWIKLDVPLIETEKDDAKVDVDGSAIVARALAERTALHVEDEIAGR